MILVPIYPAREDPIPGITSDRLAEEIRTRNKNVVSLHGFGEIEQELRVATSAQDLILTMGAGDIYKVADKLVK